MTTDTTPRLMAFLFTDLVDSTRLKGELGDEIYVRTVAQPHNSLFRRILRDFPSSRERDNAGDGFFATFDSVSDAVKFALLFQYEIRSGAWERIVPQTRIGIHLGEAIEFDDPGSDQVKSAGQAQDLAARLMGLALGGQNLLTRPASDNARQNVREHPPVAKSDPLPLQWPAHGRFKFKGNDEPLEVFEVGVVGQAPLTETVTVFNLA